MPTIINANCLDALRDMPDNSVDAICADPPYGLSNTTPDKVADTIVRWASGDREHVPTGKGFMGAAWDAFVPPPAVWDECYRVLKPGGHLAVFAGSRTQDLMGISVRLAGFDIRDSLAWLYGSGFPKSLDVSKAIDKVRDDSADVEAVRRYLHKRCAELGVTRGTIAKHLNVDPRMVRKWVGDKPDPQRHCPTWAQWTALRDLLNMPGDMDAEVARLNGLKGTPGENWDKRPITQIGTREDTRSEHVNFDQRSSSDRERRDIAATPESGKWSGWGTSLKPAHEPVLLARKPLQGTVAANVTTWGTGAINIDATRIGLGDEKPPNGSGNDLGYHGGGSGTGGNTTPTAGRFPANVVLDEHAAHELDQQSGDRGGHSQPHVTTGMDSSFPNKWGTGEKSFYADKGGASRFFYVAKAPKRERPNVDGVQHPTVKPLALMRWLVRLLTPPGGVVLDPFAGSGTTVEAAMLEGFNPIGIEAHEPYIALIEQRIERATAA